MPLLNLPPELTRIIAMNLDFEDVCRFQKTCSAVYRATSDVSFYFGFVTTKSPNNAISRVYEHRRQMHNWKNVVERLYNNTNEFAHFFNNYRKLQLHDQQEYNINLTGSEVERLGLELGNIFGALITTFIRYDEDHSITELHGKILELRRNNAELAKSPYWHSFEDVALSQTQYYMDK